MKILTAKEMKQMAFNARKNLAEKFLTNNFEDLYKYAEVGQYHSSLYRPNDMPYEVWVNVKKQLENLGYEVDVNHYGNVYEVYWEKEDVKK